MPLGELAVAGFRACGGRQNPRRFVVADLLSRYARGPREVPSTLSGGEAQRVKLAKELGQRSTGRMLYLLDEPTTGLHVADTARLLGVLQQFVDAGNTAVAVEHDLHVIEAADWVIDLGPAGGAAGGEIVAEGTPEQVAGMAASHTGAFLR